MSLDPSTRTPLEEWCDSHKNESVDWFCRGLNREPFHSLISGVDLRDLGAFWLTASIETNLADPSPDYYRSSTSLTLGIASFPLSSTSQKLWNDFVSAPMNLSPRLSQYNKVDYVCPFNDKHTSDDEPLLLAQLPTVYPTQIPGVSESSATAPIYYASSTPAGSRSLSGESEGANFIDAFQTAHEPGPYSFDVDVLVASHSATFKLQTVREKTLSPSNQVQDKAYKKKQSKDQRRVHNAKTQREWRARQQRLREFVRFR